MTRHWLAFLSIALLLPLANPVVIRAAEDTDSPEYWKPAQKAISDLGDGFLVWESRRENDTWAIWTIKLDGTGLRRLTPRDGRFHNAAHISPDGKRVVYLSQPKGDLDKLPESERRTPLHLINIDGTGDHIIVPDARMYGWPRAAVWFNDNELAYIDPAGNTYRLNLITGESKPLYMGGGLWLPNAKLTHMAQCFSTFCPYDAKEQKISGLPALGGCQPYFTQDGNWGFWMHGGEQVAKMNLATRVIGPIIEGHQMVEDRDHLYCPMISDNSMLLAFVGCNSKKLIAGDNGGYFGCSLSPYKIFVIRLDPNTLEMVSSPVRYTFEVPCDRFPDVWQATPAFGYRSDKAPYTLEVTTNGLSADAKWDFGDGATGTSAMGKHTYDKPGVYVFKVLDGDKDLRGLVRVGEPKPPKATGAIVENEKEIVVLFDEPVQLKNATASLESGGKIERLQPAEDNRSLRAILPARPTKNDWLLLDNITDRAQHPHPMTKARLAVQASLWPTNRKGLSFVWETGDKPNTARDPMTGQVQTYGLVGYGWTWTDHNNALVLNGGMGNFFGMGESFNNAVRRTKGFTIELTITPRDVTSKRQHICSYGLWQNGNKLSFEAPGKTVELGVVEANQRYHLMLTYAPGRLIGYVNGQEAVNTNAVTDSLEGNWPGSNLVLGGDLDGGAWMGTVEGAALYDRVLGPEEARANCEAQQSILKARKPVPLLEVAAKLVASSKVPTPQEAAPYLRAFSVLEYEIEKVIRGEYKSKRIRVAHWVVLNGEPTPIARMPLGDQAHLILEPFADNRQLADDTITDTLEINPDLPLYFGVQESWQDTHRIPEWNMVGRFGGVIAPIEGTANEGLDARNWAAPRTIDGMRNVTQTYKLEGNQAWKIGKPDAKGQVYLWDLPQQGGDLGYAVAYVRCPEDRKGFLSVGSTYRSRAWLNGEQVLDVPNYNRYPFFGYRRAPIQLKKGWNEILIRASNLHAFFAFACDVLDGQGKAMTDLEFASDAAKAK